MPAKVLICNCAFSTITAEFLPANAKSLLQETLLILTKKSPWLFLLIPEPTPIIRVI
jgi:hypothetical protein